MKTASKEVRLIAIRAYESGLPRQQVADIVGYHLNSVSRWIRDMNKKIAWNHILVVIEFLSFRRANATNLLSF